MNVTETEAKMRKAFAMMDGDNDGRIGRDDILYALKAYNSKGVSEADVDNLVANMNGQDDQISLSVRVSCLYAFLSLHS
jgi:Ca2+-binding EF-hand superfamily protein